jgi:hypothetical protein
MYFSTRFFVTRRYGIWKDECKFQVSENKMFRKTFGHKKNEVSELCRASHNNELHNLHKLEVLLEYLNLRRYDELHMYPEKIRLAYRTTARKPLGKRSLESLGRRCEDNIKMDLTDTGYDDGRYM